MDQALQDVMNIRLNLTLVKDKKPEKEEESDSDSDEDYDKVTDPTSKYNPPIT